MGKFFKVVVMRSLKFKQKFHVLFIGGIVACEIPVFWKKMQCMPAALHSNCAKKPCMENSFYKHLHLTN